MKIQIINKDRRMIKELLVLCKSRMMHRLDFYLIIVYRYEKRYCEVIWQVEAAYKIWMQCPRHKFERFEKETLSLPILRSWLKISSKSTGGSHEKCTCSPVWGCWNLQKQRNDSKTL